MNRFFDTCRYPKHWIGWRNEATSGESQPFVHATSPPYDFAGTLRVHVVEARGLHDPNMMKKLVPYIEIKVANTKRKTGKYNAKSSKVSKNPHWNEWLEFHLDGTEQSMRLKAYTSGSVSDSEIGLARIPIQDVIRLHCLDPTSELLGKILAAAPPVPGDGDVGIIGSGQGDDERKVKEGEASLSHANGTEKSEDAAAKLTILKEYINGWDLPQSKKAAILAILEDSSSTSSSVDKKPDESSIATAQVTREPQFEAWFDIGRDKGQRTASGQVKLEFEFVPARAIVRQARVRRSRTDDSVDLSSPSNTAPANLGQLIDDSVRNPGGVGRQFHGIPADPKRKVGNVFGRSLAESLRGDETIPAVMRQAVEYLQSDEAHLQTEGLFRVPGNNDMMKAYSEAIEQGRTCDFDEANDAAGILKRYLREMNPPLFPFEAYAGFLAVEGDKSAPDSFKFAAYRKLVQELPELNRTAIEYLFTFLAKVMAHSEVNLMTPRNLAIVFAPNLLRKDTTDRRQSVFDRLHAGIACVETMLRGVDVIFGDEQQDVGGEGSGDDEDGESEEEEDEEEEDGDSEDDEEDSGYEEPRRRRRHGRQRSEDSVDSNDSRSRPQRRRRGGGTAGARRGRGPPTRGREAARSGGRSGATRGRGTAGRGRTDRTRGGRAGRPGSGGGGGGGSAARSRSRPASRRGGRGERDASDRQGRSSKDAAAAKARRNTAHPSALAKASVAASAGGKRGAGVSRAADDSSAGTATRKRKPGHARRKSAYPGASKPTGDAAARARARAAAAAAASASAGKARTPAPRRRSMTAGGRSKKRAQAAPF